MPALSLPVLAAPVTEASAPPWFSSEPSGWHRFDATGRAFLFVPDGSRIYAIDPAALARIAPALADEALSELGLAAMGIRALHAVDDRAPEMMPVRSLSLAVAQKCNLGCTYCYAQEGNFGDIAKAMPLDVARAAVDRLFTDVTSQERVQLAFLGGEPLLGRSVLRAATERAVMLARQRGVAIGFSITTNGTLLTPDDGEFFERHGFAVTVSLDGIGETHDRLRSFKSRRGSFGRIINNVRPLLALQNRMQVSARVTVTPRNLELRQTLDELIELGFQSVGFSPMLSSPTGRDQMAPDDLAVMLDQMMACGREFERRLSSGCWYPFANLNHRARLCSWHECCVA
jgi:uncharacterized protein